VARRGLDSRGLLRRQGLTLLFDRLPQAVFRVHVLLVELEAAFLGQLFHGFVTGKKLVVGHVQAGVWP